MKPITIIIPYAYTIKWLQILLTSLKENTDLSLIDIWVMNNTPQPDKSIEGILGTPLAEDVKIINVPHNMAWHGGCIDYALPMIKTPYFIMCESDCQVLSKDWISNFLKPMKDGVAMAGWFWEGGDRNYIGPGCTIYDTAIVMKIREEVMQDKTVTFPYGINLDHEHTLEPRLQEMIANEEWGPFMETRGFNNAVERDDKWWQEPCAWLFYKCKSLGYECVELSGQFTTVKSNDYDIASGTLYGEPPYYFVHYWGGTVSHNWEKQKVVSVWEINALPWWVKRENKIWHQVVSEEVKQKTVELGLDFNDDFILNHPNIIRTI